MVRFPFRQFATSMFAALLLSLPVSASASVVPPAELVKRGMELVRAGDYPAGIKKLEAAWLMQPEDVRVMYQLGLGYYNFGVEEGRLELIERAQELWEQAAANIPDDGDNMMRMTLKDIVSRAEERKQDVEERLALEKTLAESPNAIEEGLAYAKILRRKGRVDEAAALYQRLASEHLSDPRPFTEMAVLVNGMGRLLWAESYFTQALMRDPSYQPAREGLAELLTSLEALRVEGFENLVKSSH